MKVEFYIGKLVDRRYPRLYSRGTGSKMISRGIDDKYMWDFFPWLNKKYVNEQIDYHKLYLAGTEVLVVSLCVDLSQEIYFDKRGKLFTLYENNEIDGLLEQFNKDINNEK